MAAIRRFCDSWNQRCRPFTWTKNADQILTKLKRQDTSATDSWPPQGASEKLGA